MIKRFLESHAKKLAKKYPLITLTGPRQSGKTTLARRVFPNYNYVSLEDPDQRDFAEKDPRGFLAEYDNHVILDEIQRVPEIFSYLQTLVDNNPSAGRYILTGSQQFLLNEKISQSLAGRTALLRLLPFSLAELVRRGPQKLWGGQKSITECAAPNQSLNDILFHGLYPRIYDKKLDPVQWYKDYYDTYISRDVREMINIGDLKGFEQFLRLLAGRSGQILNLTSLGNDAGVTHTTARRWLSILEASYIVFLLPPHFANFHKRIIKSPKVYFLDPGLLCSLLRINSPKDLSSHPLIGNIFETFVVSELYKWFSHEAKDPPLYFWRDKSGNEIDLIIDYGKNLYPIEIKSAKTIAANFFKGLKYWMSLPDNSQKNGALVFGGNTFRRTREFSVLPWFAVS